MATISLAYGGSCSGTTKGTQISHGIEFNLGKTEKYFQEKMKGKVTFVKTTGLCQLESVQMESSEEIHMKTATYRQ